MAPGLFLCGILSVIIAANKGFKALRWFLSFGVIGLIVVINLSSAKTPGITSEESAARAAKADKVGAWMCGICLLLSVIAGLAIKDIPTLRP